MSMLRFIVSALAFIASCEASGLGHIVPAVRSVPVVRYAPFYSFSNAVRSIHAVSPALPIAPVLRAVAPAPVATPVLQAPFAAPVLPAPPPLFAVRTLPTPAFPPPVVRTPFLPAPIPAPLPAPVIAPAPVFTGIPAAAPVYPTVTRFAPIPTLPAAPIFTRAHPVLSSVPFSPIIRPVAPAPVIPAPVFGPVPIGLPRTVAYPAPAPFLPARSVNHIEAWK